ncbi:MAG: transcription-repair coupling factor [Thermodesulfobacteria bacterium]|nr:transcription-repair coupling factor [Thermodesulfobacteriota bacterium]
MELASIKKISGVTPSFLAYLLTTEKLKFKGRILVIFPEIEKAKNFVSALQSFSKIDVNWFPPQDLPPFSQSITFSTTEAERILGVWKSVSSKISVTTISAIMRKIPDLTVLKKGYLYIIPGEELNRDEFVEKLVLLGYERVGVVKEPGCFSVKGAVIDLWSPNYANPVRMEFFGREVTSLRLFSPETQRTIETIEELTILPVKELFFAESPEKIYKRILELKNKVSEKWLSTLLQQIENKAILEATDYLLPLFFERLRTFVEVFLSRPEGKIILYEPESLEKEALLFENKVHIAVEKAKKLGKLGFEPEEVYSNWDEVSSILEKNEPVIVRELSFCDTQEKGELSFEVKSKEVLEVSGKARIETAFNLLKESIEAQEKIWLVVSDEKTEKVIKEGLTYRGVENPDIIKFLRGELVEGFFYPEERLWVTSEYELFGKTPLKKSTSARSVKRAKGHFRSFEELKEGDLVVHRTYGIGKYLGLKVLDIGGIKGEFIEVEYEGGDKLYLPVSRLDELYPYVGAGDKEPKLDKLGRQTFLKRKKKVEKELKEVVQELLSLYAERRAIESFAIPFPALAYEEFSATFPYEETPDQKVAIQEIINDLCSNKPMERLLVGDVGFGKTEVALRAIFLVAYSGKQVAFLVPTTILAEQHYQSIKPRLEAFGIKVGVLSRLRSEKEQKQILKGLAEGEIKVVIGTHRLLSPDVQFKDLGLLVIDEEHRFGVKQKEKIKQLKKSVKVLSLSATPIPRSLQMSLLGIFDLSVIESPPPGRKPVKTILAKFEPEIIKHAIETELERGGQVFFVNPRIQGLTSLAKYVKNLVPDARVEIIHGQMPPELIEKNLYKFLAKEVDVLVCTAIIGSGIDIPSANTIIINRADMFGLADIYQLRGRVGRSHQEAYAYLLVPSLKAISEEAQKRFKALLKFSELGSGFKLALSDLKIRGAGQLLGIKQSGHINTVGYELYLELLENTVKAIKGEVVEEWEPEVNFKIPAYIPQDYIPDARERLSLYSDLVVAKELEQLKDFREYILDKYGHIPEEFENLIKIFELKALMRKVGIPYIEAKGRELVFVIKNKEFLPRFRRLLKDFRFVVRHEDTISKLIFKGVKEPLNLALEVCKRLM